MTTTTPPPETLPDSTLPENTLPETWPHCGRISWPDWSGCDPTLLASEILRDWTPAEIARFTDPWPESARDDQWPPHQAQGGGAWTMWLILGGRGAGKTRAGAEFVRGMALGLPGYAHAPVGRIALVGESAAEVRDVMVEGVSGLLSIHRRGERPLWEPSRRRLEWPNGAMAQVFSAEDPERLRGPQFDCAWLDELAKWPHAEAAFDMLQFGLRLGAHPRQVVTTTPRAVPLLKRLLADPRTAITRAATLANAKNLSPVFLDRVVARYAGTRLGRQELEGELIEERADALWSRDLLEACRVDKAPALERIVVAVDPPAASHKRADKCGIIAAGRDARGHVYVLEDASLAEARPDAWANIAVGLWHKLEADALVAEVNQGGDMVAAVIAAADPSVPVTKVRATRGKYLRAAPVAQLYAQGRVKHVGAFGPLEDEMCSFGADGLPSGRSPDRLDALVWAVHALALAPQGRPKMRFL